MTQDINSLINNYSQQQDPAAVSGALDGLGEKWDTGCNKPFLKFSEERTYAIRILPQFETPHQWWMHGHFYGWSVSSSLKRGLSPKTFGGDDIFADYIDANFPYLDENEPNFQMHNEFRSLRPSYRIFCYVLFLGIIDNNWQLQPVADNDPNEIKIWDMPYKRGGFQEALEPTIRQMMAQRLNPVDLKQGFNASFTVVGKKRQRTITSFQWWTQQPSCAWGSEEAMMHYLQQQYMPINECFDVLSSEDLQKWIDFYEPLCELSRREPSKHLSPRKPDSRNQALNMLQLLDGTTGGQQQPPPPPTGQQSMGAPPPQQPAASPMNVGQPVAPLSMSPPAGAAVAPPPQQASPPPPPQQASPPPPPQPQQSQPAASGPPPFLGGQPAGAPAQTPTGVPQQSVPATPPQQSQPPVGTAPPPPFQPGPGATPGQPS